MPDITGRQGATMVYTEMNSGFQKSKDYLVCVDSDGCAMDTMDIKHTACFGPCMIAEWNLTPFRAELLRRWNQINLYTVTRGINRFKGLSKMLQEVNTSYTRVENIDALVRWVEEASELSNRSLANAINENNSPILKKAYAWSHAVNQAIAKLPREQIKPFAGVNRALAAAHSWADIAVVSSANRKAVEDEWSRYNLIEHTDLVLAQDAGTKTHCIKELCQKGYSPENIIMIGDAPGDADAALDNGVLYFPILVRLEQKSWETFLHTALPKFLDGTYQGKYQQSLLKAFYDNLSE
ncbi:MAG: hypothetical protein RHS_5835 [Robinsoniella sp. RHS]|nr:MAG: hypothetical protein RHS_5835 [Robinsoniella sp. RHS]